MGRKKGGKNSDTDLKAQETLLAKINSGKTHEEVAQDEGVHHSTVSRRIQKALNSDQIQSIINTSRDRLIQMISRCDDAYLNVLTHKDPMNFGNQIKVAQSIYRTFGLLQDEAQIHVQNIIPIQVRINDAERGDRVYEITPVRHNQSSSKAGGSV